MSNPCFILWPCTNGFLLSVWISSDNVKAVVDKGFKLIHAASDFFYLVSTVSATHVTDFGSLTFDRIVEVEVGLGLILQGMY